jgi:hypothetical protein
MAMNLSIRLYLTANVIVIIIFSALNGAHIDIDIFLLITLFSLLLSLPALVLLVLFFSMIWKTGIRVSNMWVLLVLVTGFSGCIPGVILAYYIGMHSDNVYLFLLGAGSAWLAALFHRRSIHQYFK